MKNPWLYILGALLWLFAGLAQYIPAPSIVVPAFAQCSVTGPQTVNPPNVVSGVDGSCNLTRRQVNYTDLAFPALFGLATTASNQVTVALGDQTFYLDQDPGYQQGYTVQVVSLIDPQAWMTGRISALSTAGGQTQITVSVTQDQGDSFTGSSWYLQIVSSDAAFIPVTGVSLSSLTFGTGAGQISQGGVVNLTTETGLLLNNSHIVVVAIGSPTNYFRGISQYNSSTGALTIYTTDSSGSGTFTAWSLFAQDGPPVNANQIALSQTPVTLGAGTLAFTIQAGQNLPIQGPVTITALSATGNQALGTIAAYSGTTLSVLVPSTGIYGSGNYAAWSILNTGPPQTRIPLFSSVGLQMAQVGTGSTMTINAGSVRDSTDTVDLVLSSPVTIDFTSSTNMVTVAGAGTISSSGLAVTGSGTAFTTFFKGSFFTDYNNQLVATSQGSTQNFNAVISTSSQGASIVSVSTDTSLSTGNNLGAGAGTSYNRGGPVNTNNTIAVYYGIVLAMNTTTGVSSIYISSATPSGTPDLPAGSNTYYRVIGIVSLQFVISSSKWFIFPAQPLVQNPMAQQGDIFYYVSGQGAQTTFNTRLPIGAANSLLTVAGGIPSWQPLLSIAFSQLLADVNLNNTSNFFTGPQIAQGASGVWWVTGKATVTGTSGDAITCKLWDGTTNYDSGSADAIGANTGASIPLAGILSNMAGNIRISCKDGTNTTGKIRFNATGVGTDSTIWGMRIQ